MRLTFDAFVTLGCQSGTQCDRDAWHFCWYRVAGCEAGARINNRGEEGTILTPRASSDTRPMHNQLTDSGSPQYLFLWQVFYATDLVFIKASILTALKRVDKERRYAYILWGLIVLVSLLGIGAIITLLARCRPIQASWTSDGTCINSDSFVALAKTAYVFDVLSDLAIATISTPLLWAPGMRLGSKVLTGSAMGLGVV